MVDFQYPIGRFVKPVLFQPDKVEEWIADLERFPGQLKNLVGDLTDQELSQTYRSGGWTIRQLVHHCADSHINAYARIKLALTEEAPTIKPYNEKRWAELADSVLCPVHFSIVLLEGLHQRLTVVLRSLSPEEFKRPYYHPDQASETAIYAVVALYAWHSTHHLAHIKLALKQS